jgi:hypothetical protein
MTALEPACALCRRRLEAGGGRAFVIEEPVRAPAPEGAETASPLRLERRLRRRTVEVCEACLKRLEAGASFQALEERGALKGLALGIGAALLFCLLVILALPFIKSALWLS